MLQLYIFLGSIFLFLCCHKTGIMLWLDLAAKNMFMLLNITTSE